MAVGRIGPVARLLGDGRVLVLGGAYDPEGTTAEVWDPATGSCHATEGLNKPRAAFVTVALADGRALVAGGLNESGQSYSSAYVFDARPGHETWSKVGLLNAARTAPSAAVLLDGRVLVAGGYYAVEPHYGQVGAPEGVLMASDARGLADNAPSGSRFADVEPPNVGAALATAELFDLATGTWSTTGSMNYARCGAEAVTLADGRVLVVGSCGSSGQVTVDRRSFDSAEIYDPATGRFTLTGLLPDIDRPELQDLGPPESVSNGTLVALEDGGAVLIGRSGSWKHVGNITRSFRFDARTERWTEIGQTYYYIGEQESTPLMTPGARNLEGATVARLRDGRILIAGGYDPIVFVEDPANGGSHYDTGRVTTLAEAYDPTTDTWSALPPMPEARLSASGVALMDGSVLLVGGMDVLTGESMTSAVRFVP